MTNWSLQSCQRWPQASASSIGFLGARYKTTGVRGEKITGWKDEVRVNTIFQCHHGWINRALTYQIDLGHGQFRSTQWYRVNATFLSIYVCIYIPYRSKTSSYWRFYSVRLDLSGFLRRLETQSGVNGGRSEHVSDRAGGPSFATFGSLRENHRHKRGGGRAVATCWQKQNIQ